MKSQWWGHSAKRGWVVLDRTLEENKIRKGGEWLFYDTVSKSFFRITDQTWRAPDYIFSPDFIASLTPDSQREVSATLSALQIDFSDLTEQYQELLVSEAAEKRTAENLKIAQTVELQLRLETERWEREKEAFPENRAIFLRGLDLIDPGTRKVVSLVRVARCYRCSQPLDNRIDIECNACGWIICTCGACGCGFHK